MEGSDLYLDIQRIGEGAERRKLEAHQILTFGRAFGNDVVLPGTGISRRHARIIHRDGTFWLEDLASYNGTLLNGELVDSLRPLARGDLIEISQHRIEVGPDTPTGELDYAEISDESIVHSRSMQTVLDRDFAPTGEHDPATDPEMATALFRKLDSVSLALLAHRPLHELYDQILLQVEENLGAERSALLMRDGKSGELIQEASRGVASESRRLPVSRSIARRVIEERHAILIEDAQHDQRFQHQDSVIIQGVRSALCVPLWDDRDVIGLLYADKVRRAAPFDQSELQLLTLIGHLSAVKIRATQDEEALQQQRQMEKELADAARIQQQLLPSDCFERDDYALCGRNIPCLGVGGDYFDFFGNADGSVTVAFGDVSGKGMSAALLMSSLHSRVQAYNEAGMELAEITTRLGDYLHAQIEGTRNITFFLARFDPAAGFLDFVNAGHNPPLLISEDGTIKELFSGELLLGPFEGVDYTSLRVEVKPGDRLLIYSDGVTEAENSRGEDYGTDRLRAFLTEHRNLSASDIADSLIQDVHDFAHPESPFDDLSIVVLRRY